METEAGQCYNFYKDNIGTLSMVSKWIAEGKFENAEELLFIEIKNFITYDNELTIQTNLEGYENRTTEEKLVILKEIRSNL